MRLWLAAVAIRVAFEACFDLLGFFDTNRARVRLLFRYAYLWQDIENCFAFNF